MIYANESVREKIEGQVTVFEQFHGISIKERTHLVDMLNFVFKYELQEAEERGMRKKIDSLKDLVKVQCSDGNWNYSEYMHGMANGMIVALSVFTDEEPVFLDKPAQWLCDIPSDTIAQELMKGEGV